jgi:hypothetical protein
MMRCVIEGWPDDGDIDGALHGALTGLVARLTTDWPLAIRVVPAVGVFRIEAQAADWPQLARLVALAMRMCGTRAMWLWHITDDAGAIARELGRPGLCAWRGMFCQLSGAPADWSPATITRSEPIDEDIRDALAAVIPDVLAELGIRAPEAAVPAETPTDVERRELELFEFIPPDDWMAAEQPAAVGRSMVQVDARRGEVHHIKGRIEIGNPGRQPAGAIRVQVTLRGAEGVLLGAISGEAASLPPGSVRVVTVSGEVALGRQRVSSIDIGCQVIAQVSAPFAARVLEV